MAGDDRLAEDMNSADLLHGALIEERLFAVPAAPREIPPANHDKNDRQDDEEKSVHLPTEIGQERESAGDQRRDAEPDEDVAGCEESARRSPKPSRQAV